MTNLASAAEGYVGLLIFCFPVAEEIDGERNLPSVSLWEVVCRFLCSCFYKGNLIDSVNVPY